MDPLHDALVELALRHTTPQARLLWLRGPSVAPPRLASRRVTRIPLDDAALPYLRAHAPDPFDALLCARPTLDAPLLPLLGAARDAVAPEGALLLVDLVWQTAPSPELIRAFAPPPGREKVRPIEGYEMQAEHAGFDVLAREVVEPARWAPLLEPAQRAAVEADARGAARMAAWVLRRASDE